MTDAQKARALRDQYSMGIREAFRIVKGERLLAQINEAGSIDSLKNVLEEIVADLYPKRPR